MIAIKQALYYIVGIIAQIHDRLLRINDGFPVALSDKDLHFLVIGLLGMGLFFIVHPIFKALARRGHEAVVSWIYVFTLIIVITFSIEIGQHITHTGTLEFADIAFGVVGFLAFFAVFALFRLIVRALAGLVRHRRGRRGLSSASRRAEEDLPV